ncbi:Fanconi anemia group M protein homolog [Anopheles moucheti]|uniref:Fanconi anemia group M protein homolog n=1 Tax=Anopheles moucheti TaxID=186751 RepID=UPI0022EFE5BD|nr:Fanconi anemia group M protein homolog [Anopheles moucheti]
MAQNISNDSLDDIENRSDVLNQTRYSLQDAFALRNDPFELNDVELLDTSVTDLMDDPYRMKLRRNSNCDGFDQSLGDSWIYPANYPMRRYQFAITEAALFKNTLVVLPTGLGKTFIAAVVMYNIYRWYPTGKVIFMAPTRPLVSQQIEACYRIMGIPRSDTAEVTGKQPRHNRSTLWQTKRVFYATPQVVQADLESSEQILPVEQVRLVVIDEAHKAKGRYAYANVIQRIAEHNPNFRVLALSATPGRTLEDVAEVIKNLLISHVEVRWENSIDVLPYVFRKDVRTIVIPLGQTIASVRRELQRLVNPYLQRLLESNVFTHYPGTITPGMLIMRQKQYRGNALLQRHPNHSVIIADFGVCISMYHAMDLLVKHGIRTFLNFFDDNGGTNGQEKYFVAKDRQIKTFLDQLREQFQHRERQQSANDSGIITGNDDIDFGHPKYRILEQQLMTFFKEFPDSKSIVFCEFRDSVAMIKRMLSNNQPLIRPNCIVGQSRASGVRVAQHEQIDVMRHFRSGTYNTLIATCVAEEGIDVGEVDLIVCFDIAKNPMRFVQRIGRTGRQRVGRVLMLVTEGEEHDTLKHVLASKDKTNQQLARSKDILRILYPHSPRLVPPGLQPKCVTMYMNIPDEQATVRQVRSDSSDGEGHSANIKSGRKRKKTKRLNDANEAIEPSSKRNKRTTRTRDVRDFFTRQRTDPTDPLDARERDIFAVESPIRGNKDGLMDRSHIVNTSIPIDHTIRLGRTDTQVAIDTLLQPLVQHYRKLCRHKFLYRQKLLDTPKLARIELHEASRNVPVQDDLLDLPELVPHGMVRADASQAAEECFIVDKSISNLFDSSLCLMETTSNVTCPQESPTIPPKASAIVSGKKSRVSTLKKLKKQSTSPKDLSNSPLLLAFNRSVQKRINSDSLETPARSNRNVVPSEILQGQRCSVSQRIVLEYFHLKSLDDIFEDDSLDWSVPETDAAVNEGQQSGERLKGTSISRKLFGSEHKTEQTTNKVAEIFVPKEDTYVCKQPILEITSDIQHKTSTDRRLESCSNVSMKNFDLGTAELIFQDDSTSDRYDSPTSFKSTFIDLPQSQTSALKKASLCTQKHTVSDTISKDAMYCLPGKSPYFVASLAKITPAGKAKNENKSLDISEPMDMGSVSSTNNHSWVEEVGMNDSIIGQKTRPARIDSSSESLFDDQPNNAIRRLIGSSIRDEEKNDDVFCHAPEVRSSNQYKKQYMDMGSRRSINNNSWVDEVGMNESIIGQKTRPARIESSSESLFDDQPNDAIHRPIGSSIRDEEKNDDVFRHAPEVRSSNQYKKQYMDMGSGRSINNNSWVDEVGMNESIIGQKTRPARIESSSESLFDDQPNDAIHRPIGSSIRDEEKNDDVFRHAPEVCSSNQYKKQLNRGQNNIKKGKRLGRGFLLTQAAVSDDDGDDESGDESDGINSLASFVTSSDDERCTGDMRAVYLQSVRSPLASRGRFKIPPNALNTRDRLPVLNDTDAYHSVEDSCAMDEKDTELCSFVDDNIIKNSDTELSELEIAERILKERRRRKRQARCSGENILTGTKKRRRVIQMISSDSD